LHRKKSNYGELQFISPKNSLGDTNISLNESSKLYSTSLNNKIAAGLNLDLNLNQSSAKDLNDLEIELISKRGGYINTLTDK